MQGRSFFSGHGTSEIAHPLLSRQSAFSGLGSGWQQGWAEQWEAMGHKLSQDKKGMPIRLALLLASELEDHVSPLNGKSSRST